MRNPSIRQKIPVFIAGEGQSEEGYWRWLARLPGGPRNIAAIHTFRLAGGDMLEMVATASQKLRHYERFRGTALHRAVILDIEHKAGSINRIRQAEKLIERNRFCLIWQNPSHEGFLVRHFRGWEDHRPTTRQGAERLLVRIWPEFEKGMDAAGYAKKLTRDHVAVARSVETDFDAFLTRIGC